MLAYFRIKPVTESDREKSRATLEQFLSQEERDEAAETLRRFNAAHRRLSANSAALRRQYPDQWVAMDAKRGVLAAADTEGDLRRKIAALGCPQDGIAYRRMNANHKHRILIT